MWQSPVACTAVAANAKLCGIFQNGHLTVIRLAEMQLIFQPEREWEREGESGRQCAQKQILPQASRKRKSSKMLSFCIFAKAKAAQRNRPSLACPALGVDIDIARQHQQQH